MLYGSSANKPGQGKTNNPGQRSQWFRRHSSSLIENDRFCRTAKKIEKMPGRYHDVHVYDVYTVYDGFIDVGDSDVGDKLAW